ncbi:hypothetical protein [Nocardioides sp. LHG3406-4]|uniref:hypothetical protein n=1 Tax=Nocardioides sp. LHG3406-4 TaxID=2804575 RepID=UPI003CFBA6E9
MSDELEHRDIEAALAARRELGASYDAALVDSFADRVEREIERRVGVEVASRERSQRANESAGARQLALGIVSLLAAIPVSIVLGIQGEGVALLSALFALVMVNWAHAWQSRRP